MISEKFLKNNSPTPERELDQLYYFLLDNSDSFETELFSQLFTRVARWEPGKNADKVFLKSYEKTFNEVRVRGPIPVDFSTSFRTLHMVVTHAEKGVEFFRALSFFYRSMISQCEFEMLEYLAEKSEVSS